MKLRDLQQSHDLRESVNKWGEHNRRRRVIVAPSSQGAVEKDVTISVDNVQNERPLQGARKVSAIDTEIEEIQPKREELKTWVEDRKSLREGLNSLCLSKSLLKNKPDKTLCEIRVLRNMKEREDRRVYTSDDLPIFSNVPKLSTARLSVLPILESPLPIALGIIADFLQETRLRLLDLFSKADRNKDWLTTREELRYSLKESGVPLTDGQIDELVLTLDINNDDQLSYKELAMGIDAFRKDKRWRKLKEIFDVLVEKGETEQELAESYQERKVAMNLLRLPNVDGPKQNMELFDHMSSRERKIRMLEEKRRKRRVKIKDGVKAEYITTLSGVVGNSKMRYLQFIDKECKRCIEQMHKYDLPMKSEDLVNILIPPAENPRNVCESHLGCNRSIFPLNHRMNWRHRHGQDEESQQNFPFSYTNTESSSASTLASLPRVATTDFKNRAKEGRTRREQFRRTSPTACWPQHLLDKLHIYMENDELSDGKEVLFSLVRRT